MINTLSILFSLVGVVLVIVRASMLDRTTPWFTKPQARPAPVVASRPAQRKAPQSGVSSSSRYDGHYRP